MELVCIVISAVPTFVVPDVPVYKYISPTLLLPDVLSCHMIYIVFVPVPLYE